jgi:beta-galactosidase
MSRKRNGNPSNNPAWRAEYVQRVTSAIYTTKRHPCVVAYYLADDSTNGICLYEAYLAAKAITDIPVFYEDGGNEWNSDDVYTR